MILLNSESVSETAVSTDWSCQLLKKHDNKINFLKRLMWFSSWYNKKFIYNMNIWNSWNEKQWMIKH